MGNARATRPTRVARELPQRVAERRPASSRRPKRGRVYEGALGMVVLDYSNPFFGEVANAAEAAAEQQGYALVLTHSSGSEDKQAAMLELLESRNVDGLLLTPVDARVEVLAPLLDRSVPIVLVDCHSPRDDVSSIAVDNVQGGLLAGQHLLRQGHERIAMLNGPATLEVCIARHQGLAQAVEDAGLDPDEVVEQVIVPATNEYEGQRAADAILQTGATAVFCANDLLAVGLMRELTSRDVAIPGDLAVMGYDDIELAYSLNPPLSTIRQPMKELGTLAAQQLIAEIRGGRVKLRELDPQLVTRDSTGA